MKLYKILGTIILCSVFLFQGCSLFPSHETVDAPRKDSGISSDNNDISSVIQGFINTGDKIIEINEKDKSKPYYLADIDGDNSDEVITVYMHQDTLPEYCLMVLKKGEKTWEKFYDDSTLKEYTKSYAGNAFITEPVKSIEFNDITGDNIPEVLVMHEYNNLVVYRYYKETINKFGICLSNKCTSYKIADLPGENGPDGMLELYIENSDPDEFSIYIYRWNGITFSYVVDEFTEYLREPINSLAQKRSSHSDNYRMALTIINYQLRCGMNEEALKTAEVELASLKNIEYKNHLLGYKAKALLALGNYDQARAAAEDAIKAGNEAMEYANKSKKSIIAPGSYYNIIADSYAAEKEYDKAKEIIKTNTKLPYAEAAQDIDASIARDKICDYVRNSKFPGSIVKDIEKWGQDNNIVINCTAPANPGNFFSSIFVIDYHLNPSTVYGKENVGGHIICWVREGKFGYAYLSNIIQRADIPSTSGLLADNAQVIYGNKQIKLKVNYKNTSPDNYLPKSYTQYFLYENNNFKFAYK